jgi:hypothetical protein
MLAYQLKDIPLKRDSFYFLCIAIITSSSALKKPNTFYKAFFAPPFSCVLPDHSFKDNMLSNADAVPLRITCSLRFIHGSRKNFHVCVKYFSKQNDGKK